MATRTEFLVRAAGQIGYSRWNDEEAGTKYGRWYAQQVGNSSFGASGVPFCAMGLDWCAWGLGMNGLLGNGKHYAYVPYILADGKALGRACGLEVGALACHDWDDDGVADHVSVVELVLSGGNFQSVEFNTYDGVVARRTRHISSVQGFVRPAFDNAAPAPKPNETPAQKPDVNADAAGFVFGPICTKAWQRNVGTSPDGAVSSQWEGNRKYVVNPTTFEFVGEVQAVGSSVVLADQKKLSRLGFYKGNIDGHCGPGHIRARASYLASIGYYTLGNEDEYWGPKHSQGFYNALIAGRY